MEGYEQALKEKSVLFLFHFSFCYFFSLFPSLSLCREVNKNNLLGGQFVIFLPKNPAK